MKYSKGIFYLTMLLAIFAGLNYFFPIRKALVDKIKDVKIKQVIKKEKKKISLTLNKEIYRDERSWLLDAFNAATKMYSYDVQNENLHKVVKMSIEVNDFNMAVIAAKEIYGHVSRNNSLMEIVNVAVKDANNFGYAVLAAEEIYGYKMRNKALIIIVDSAAKFHSQDKEEKEKSDKSSTGTPELEKIQKKILEKSD